MAQKGAARFWYSFSAERKPNQLEAREVSWLQRARRRQMLNASCCRKRMQNTHTVRFSRNALCTKLRTHSTTSRNDPAQTDCGSDGNRRDKHGVGPRANQDYRLWLPRRYESRW